VTVIILLFTVSLHPLYHTFYFFFSSRRLSKLVRKRFLIKSLSLEPYKAIHTQARTRRLDATLSFKMVQVLNNNPTTSTSTSTSVDRSPYSKNRDVHPTHATPQGYTYDSPGALDHNDNERPPIPPPKDVIGSPRCGLGDTSLASSSSLSALDRSFGLPEGMDVREALAQCEDPALGWSLQFWATIADPVVSLLSCYCDC